MKGRINMQQTPDKKRLIREYAALVHRLTPKSQLGLGCLRAFWVGGAICVLGQGMADAAHLWLSLPTAASQTLASVMLVFFTALLTGIGVFDRIAQYGGAGTVVPITGFANAMVSPAMEFKPEGWVLGTGARLFTIAGPVLVYGIVSSVAVGVLYFIFRW